MLEIVNHNCIKSGLGNELEFTDIVLLDGLYCARVFGPACALAREHRAAMATRDVGIIMVDDV